MKRLVDLYNKVRQEYGKNPKLAMQMATDPIGAIAAGTQAAEMAAWAVVGNVLLNLDEAFANDDFGLIRLAPRGHASAKRKHGDGL